MYPKADLKRKRMMTYFCFLTADLSDEMVVVTENLANLAVGLTETSEKLKVMED